VRGNYEIATSESLVQKLVETLKEMKYKAGNLRCRKRELRDNVRGSVNGSRKEIQERAFYLSSL